MEFGWVGKLHTFLSPTMDIACIKLVGLVWECCIVLALELQASSETQGQIKGARESLNGRKNVARRKVKNGKKSPWGQCLTRQVPNGRRCSGF